MNRTLLVSAVAAAALFAPLAAQAQTTQQIVVDGSADNAYGAARSVQTSTTGFGNATTPDGGGGSELDQAFGVIQNGTLYVTLAGNLEENGNFYDLFIDNGLGGGQNTLNTTNNTGNLDGANGLTFDTGVSPNFAFAVSIQNGTFTVAEQTLGNNNAGTVLGSGTVDSGVGTLSTAASGSNNPFGIQAAFNDTNTAGVGGSNSGMASGAGVTSGLEFGIPLAALGNPQGALKLVGLVNGVGQSFLSNQVLGSIGSGDTNNLAGPASVNFSTIAGNQFFTVDAAPVAAPEPGTMVPLLMGALALGSMVIARRRTASVTQ